MAKSKPQEAAFDLTRPSGKLTRATKGVMMMIYEDQDRELRRIAFENDTSKSEIVRGLLDGYLAEHRG